MKQRYSLTFALFLVFTLAATSAQSGRLYRWVDADGKVHYSDKMPPEQIRREHSRLDQHGVTVNRVKAAKTPGEIKAERLLRKLQAEKQRLINEQKAADRVLLRTFRSEDDILMARNGKIAAVDVNIQVIRGNIRRYKQKLGEMHQNAGNLERAGQKISARYLDDIENTRRTLNNAYKTILIRERGKTAIREAFAEDQRRFRELNNLKAEIIPEKKVVKEDDNFILNNVFSCRDDKHCQQAWTQVETFIKQHATTPLRMRGDHIIMTAAARTDEDISITIAFLETTEKQTPRLFMDLQCKASPVGEQLCASKKVKNIHRQFRPYFAKLKN